MSAFLIITITASLYFSPYPPLYGLIPLLMSLTVGIASWEYYRLAQLKRHQPFVLGGIAVGVGYILALFAAVTGWAWPFLPSLVLAGGGFACFLRFFAGRSEPLTNLAVTLFAAFYIALTLGTFISINYFFSDRTFQDGRWWVLYLLAVTKMTDAGGYFAGKWWGNHSLAPVLSPKKTYEGAVGGLLAALGTSVLFSWLGEAFPSKVQLHLSFVEAVGLGLLVSLMGQLGDLAESLLKRDAGAKHSGLIPGLGGILDIIDSLIFTAPTVYFFLLFKTHGEIG